jgi:hypothetical protein
MRETSWALLTAVVLASGCGDPLAGEAGPPVFGAEPAQVVTSDGGGLVVKVWTAPSPPTKGSNAMRLLVSDADGAVVDDAALRAMVWMPAHGHGASVMPTVTRTDPGVYEVAPVVFYMEGRWELRGETTVTNGAGAGGDSGTDSRIDSRIDSFVATFDVP